jgi:hypothetical protein
MNAPTKPTRYAQIIEEIFISRFREGMRSVRFQREDIEAAARRLDIKLPKNLGDVIYSFRYRVAIPTTIQAKAPAGEMWIIRPEGRSQYAFVLVTDQPLLPSPLIAETKIPDATPGLVAKYALSDEQALLTKLRYNRLVDVFTGLTCYSLQNHLRTTVPDLGQVETDELYVGVDRRGAHYVVPIQAKGGNDKLSIVQIEQDVALCQAKFPTLLCRAVGAQFMPTQGIALFEFEASEQGIAVVQEKHYRLVMPDEVRPDDLALYKQRPLTD